MIFYVIGVRILIPAVFLSLVLALLCGSLQRILRLALERRPGLVFLAPAILSGLFCASAAMLGALSGPLTALILIYTLAPTVCAFLARRIPPPACIDFGVILLLWLPLELSAGQRWIPKPAQGLLHVAAYGVSIVLGLTLFLLFRSLRGMKYNLPRQGRDFLILAMGFAASAPVLILLGRAIGFLVPFHAPVGLSAANIGAEFLLILAGTALPEEILFRALIQNSLMQRFGAGTGTLLLASVIFGCAHLNNGPQPLPNWRYAILASIAGFAYGKVFEKSSSIFASAGLHALVDTVKHVSF
jgi:membrane protease YdiL (CAAX protease family)